MSISTEKTIEQELYMLNKKINNKTTYLSHLEPEFLKSIGDINKMNLLHSLGANINHNDGLSFVLSCELGEVQSVNWFKSKDFNVHFNNNEGFVRACEFGQTEVVKWFLINTKLKFDEQTWNELFSLASSNQHFDVLGLLKRYKNTGSIMS